MTRFCRDWLKRYAADVAAYGAAFAQKKRALKRAAKEGKLVLSKDAAAAAAPRASRPQFSHDDLSFVQEEIADRSKFLQQLEHLGRGAFRVLLRLSPNEGEIIVRIAFVTLSLGCAFLAFVPCSSILCSACCGFHIALHVFHSVQHSLHHRSPSLSRYISPFSFVFPSYFGGVLPLQPLAHTGCACGCGADIVLYAMPVCQLKVNPTTQRQ